MKVVAHIQVQKGYGIAIRASQSPATLMEQSEEYNREEYKNEDGMFLRIWNTRS